MYALIHYRENWEHYCSRSCNCLIDSCGSDFEIKDFIDIKSLAKFIYDKFIEYPRCNYNNIVLVGEDALFCNYVDSPSKGLGSIQVKINLEELEDYELDSKILEEIKSEIKKLGWKDEC